MDVWYFAYGSNMSEERMKGRHVDFSSRVLGKLNNYRLVFNKKADGGAFTYANVEEAESSLVEGVLYLIDEEGLESLDRAEGVAAGHYIRSAVHVESIKYGKVEAIIYLAGIDHIASGLPKKEYLNHLKGCHDLVSNEYYQKLCSTKTCD